MVAAGVAFALSLLLHIILWNEFPGLPLAKDRLMPPERVYQPIQLHDVRPTPPPPPEQTPVENRIRPENPGRLADLLGAPAPLPELAVDSFRNPKPTEVRADVPVTAPAQGATQTTPDRSRWEPRQEILTVENRVVKDEIPWLPRRFAPPAPRIPDAPDVILEIETPMQGGTSAAMATQPPQTAASGYGLTSPNGVIGGTGSGTGTGNGDGSSRDRLFPGPTELFNEKNTDVSTNRAVDRFLELVMLIYRPPDEGGAAYLELQIRRRADQTLPVLPKDVLFIQDCSESMTPWKLAACKEGLREWIGQLPSSDRFEILAFRDTVQRCFNRWEPVAEGSRLRALSFVDAMRSVGNTDVYGSLALAGRLREDSTRPVVAVLVTDGRPTAGVTGSFDIIENFTKLNNGSVPMFSAGGGRKVNRFLLDLVSYRNRGESMVVQSDEEIPTALRRWSAELARPVISDLGYRVTGYDDAQIYPKSLTPLFLDRPLVVYGRLIPGQNKAAMQLIGRAGAQSIDSIFELDASTAQAGTAAIRERWAWQKLYHLIGTYVQKRDPAVLQELRVHAARYGIPVPYGFATGVPEI